MPKGVEDDLWILVNGGIDDALFEEKVLFGQEMQGRNGEARVVEVLQADAERVCAEVDEEFKVLEELPIYNLQLLRPKNHLEDLRPLREAHSSIVLVRSLLDCFPDISQTLR